jgi:hypothetical protein
MKEMANIPQLSATSVEPTEAGPNLDRPARIRRARRRASFW